jgi:hypothetical protein
MENTMTKMALDGWYATVKRANALFDKLTDDEMKQPVAPNRNRGFYLLGHLVAVHDAMLPLLNLGDSLYPQLFEPFIRTPDGPAADFTVAELRKDWAAVNAELESRFGTLKPEEWFLKHNSVSAEDFEKEPHRNRLNIVISRTNHLSYHLGQMAFLKAK